MNNDEIKLIKLIGLIVLGSFLIWQAWSIWSYWNAKSHEESSIEQAITSSVYSKYGASNVEGISVEDNITFVGVKDVTILLTNGQERSFEWSDYSHTAL